MAEEPRKLPRTNLEEKIMIIDYFKNSNKPQSETVEHFKNKFSISTSSFSEWLKHEDELRQRYMKAVNGPEGVSDNIKLSKRKSTFKYGPINDAMHKIVSERLSMNLPVTEPILRHYWSTFTKEYGVTDPKRADCFSHGWLANFKKRHGLTKAKKPKIADDSILKDQSDISNKKNSNKSISQVLKLNSNVGSKEVEYTSDDYLRDKSKYRESIPVKNLTTLDKSSMISNKHISTNTTTADVDSTEQDDRDHYSNSKRRKTPATNSAMGLFSTSTNYTFSSSEIPIQLPLSQNVDKNKNSNSSTALNYLLISNENESSYSSLSNVRPKLDIDFPLLPTDYQKSTSISFGNINNTNVAFNNENNPIGINNNNGITKNNFRNSNNNAEEDKKENNIISGNSNNNANTSNNRASTSANFASGATSSVNQGSQFDLQQILNSHLSKPLISTPTALHSNFSINLNPVMNSRSGPPYQNLMYGRRNGSAPLAHNNINTTTAPLYANGTVTFLNNGQSTQLESLPHISKKAPNGYTPVSSTALPTQSLLSAVQTQSGVNLTSADTKGPHYNFNSGGSSAKPTIEESGHSSSSIRTVLDANDKSSKSELDSNQVRPLSSVSGHSQRRVSGEHDMRKNSSENAITNTNPSSVRNSRKNPMNGTNDSNWRFENENFDEKDMISIDDMEKLLFVYADQFFRQFKETREFDQSKELFDEFKTKFMADKLRHIAQRKSRRVSSEHANLNSAESRRDYDSGVSDNFFIRR